MDTVSIYIGAQAQALKVLHTEASFSVVSKTGINRVPSVSSSMFYPATGYSFFFHHVPVAVTGNL